MKTLLSQTITASCGFALAAVMALTFAGFSAMPAVADVANTDLSAQMDHEVDAHLAAVEMHVGACPTGAMMASVDATDLLPPTAKVEEASAADTTEIWTADYADAMGLRDTLNKLAYHDPARILEGEDSDNIVVLSAAWPQAGEAPAFVAPFDLAAHLTAPSTYLSLGSQEATPIIAANADINGMGFDATGVPFDGAFIAFS